MGTKYPGESISGYNSSPPADDGSTTEANKVKWSTIKSKITDPVKTLAEAIDSALTTHFNRGPTAISTATTLDATDYQKVYEASGTSEVTLTDAATLTAGWFVDIINKGAGTIPILRATASDTIDNTSNDINLYPLEKIRLTVNAAADGFMTDRGGPRQDYWADTGAANAYVATPYPAWTAYVTGAKISVNISAVNTGASTLNVSGLGVKNIKLQDGNNPSAYDIRASIHTFEYDGTNFVLLDPFKSSGTESWPVVTNAADTSHDLTFTAGSVFDSTNAFILSTPAYTKQIDADFATGTNAGGMNAKAAKTGTYTTSGTAVTGSGTSFDTEFAVGDVLYSPTNLEGRRIDAIGSAIGMTLSAAFTADVTSSEGVQKGGIAPSTTFVARAILNDSTGAVDIYYDTPSGDNFPSGYTYYRELFRFKLDSTSAIPLFTHTDNFVDFVSYVKDVSVAASTITSATLKEMSCPAGVNAYFGMQGAYNTTASGFIAWSPEIGSTDPAGGDDTMYDLYVSGQIGRAMKHKFVITNNLSQVYVLASVSAGSTNLYMYPSGYYLDRTL